MAPDQTASPSTTTERPTRLLHRVTSYSSTDWSGPGDHDRVVRDFEANDWDHLPRFAKDYDRGLTRLALPRDLRPATAGALDVLAGAAEVSPAPLDLRSLGRVLFLASGVTRTAEFRGRHRVFRAAGSAGARFPLELYVAIPEDRGRDLPPGVHWYDPAEHALVAIGPAPTGVAPSIVVTGVPWRTGWRYRERGFRHIYWDAGTMLSQLLAVADSAGLGARLHLTFPDHVVGELVGADGIDEFPVALVALGEQAPAIGPTGSADPGHHDADGRVFPLVTEAQHAGDGETLGPQLPRGERVRLESSVDPNLATRTMDDVILGRGSIRRLDPRQSLARETLVDAIAVAMRGIEVPHWIAASAVDGVDPGIYRWPDLSAPVRRLAEPDLREELYAAALDQGLAKDAAFVAISAIALRTLDDRGYRTAQLCAGLVEGRLHLIAGALGAAATGMTFIDTQLPALLGEDGPDGLGDNLACLLWTCVGMGEYRSGRAGTPGAPTRVRVVEPR